MRGQQSQSLATIGISTMSTSLGLALIVSGQPLAWWVRGKFTTSESALFPAAVIAIGLGLMLLAIMPKPRLHVPPVIGFLYPLLFLFPIVAMTLVDLKVLGFDFAYNLAVIAIAAVTMLTPLRQFDGFAGCLASVSALGLILAIIDFILFPSAEGFTRLGLAGNNNPLATGSLAGLAIVASTVALKAKHRSSTTRTVWFATCIIVGIAGLVLSNTRGAMLSVLFALFFLFVVVDDVRANLAKFLTILLSPFTIVAILLLTAVVTMAFGQLEQRIGGAAINTVFGVWSERLVGSFSALEASYFSPRDESVEMRILLLEKQWRDMTAMGQGIHAELRNTQGAKNVTAWAHLTPFQAFFDLGFIGASIFLITVFIFPIIIIRNTLNNNLFSLGEVMIILLYIYRIPDHFTNATPYFWWQTLPVALVYAVLARPSPKSRKIGYDLYE